MVVWVNWAILRRLLLSAWFLLAADLLEDTKLEETRCTVKYDVLFSPSERSAVLFSRPGLEVII